jgi:ADP-ribosylglycohydrolase
MTNTQLNLVNVVGSIYGLAVGDAYGDPIEFSTPVMNGIGPSAPKHFRITDDTQMSLAVAHALESWDGESLPMLRLDFMTEFLYWLHDADNNRAPGATCLSALRKLERGGAGYWQQATSPSSAGCGSVMRAAWVGLSPKVSDEQLFTVAAMQAVLTHGPAENGFAAAALAALTRSIVRGEVDPGEASDFLHEWADEHDGMEYDRTAFGTLLWKLAVTSDGAQHHESPEDYVAEGIAHVRWIADAAADLTLAFANRGLFTFDPADFSGQGWRAREAVAMAVGVFDADLGFVDSVRAAAWTKGDSDSTAAIAGALVGAYAGSTEVPFEWFARLEDRYQCEVGDVAQLIGSTV